MISFICSKNNINNRLTYCNRETDNSKEAAIFKPVLDGQRNFVRPSDFTKDIIKASL